jgi:hypothetical protein
MTIGKSFATKQTSKLFDAVSEAELVSCGTVCAFRSFCKMRKILADEFAAFREPGALIAISLVLLVMAMGDVAIAIAARGWPF